MDRASSAGAAALGLGDLEAVAACGEGCDRRSLDGVAGICFGMAFIARSFCSNLSKELRRLDWRLTNIRDVR